MCSGETDWKIIAIDVNDPLADSLNGYILYIFLHSSSSAKPLLMVNGLSKLSTLSIFLLT